MALENTTPLSALRAPNRTLMLLAALVALALAAPPASATEDAQDLGWLAGDSCLSLTDTATVSTDQDDYAPGSTVNVSGSGFGADCTYELRVFRPDGVVETFDVLTGPDGELAHSFILPPPPGVIGPYRIEVVGTGDAVVASVWFTDAIAGEQASEAANAPGGQGTLSIPKPTSTQQGDFLIAQVSAGGLSSSDRICPPTTDWVTIQTTDQGSDVRLQTFRKFAGASEPTNFVFSFRSGNCPSGGSQVARRASGGVIRYTGVHPTTPVEPAPSTNTGDGGAPPADPPPPRALSIPAVAGARIIAFYGFKKNVAMLSPAGMTERIGVFNEDGSGPSSLAADMTHSSGASTGDKVVTSTSGVKEKWAAQLVSLREAPVAPTKLAYTTPPRTGAVGQCLGPITVQTQTGSDAPANVSSATTVSLTTDGSGSFHTDAGCAGSSTSSVTIPNGGNSATFHYKAAALGDGSHGLTASATGLTSATQTQTITNPAPVLTAPADQTADEGASKSFSLGSFTDPGDAGPWSVTVDWGDGSTADTFNAAAAGSLSHDHAYADDGLYTVTVTVTDSSEQSDSKTFEVTVDNVAPVLTASVDQSAEEGESASFELGSFEDAGTDDSPWTVAVDWGEGSGSESFDVTAQGDIVRSHTYDDDDTYTVSVSVTDEDGGTSNTESFDVTVDNVAPSATFGNDGPVNEGSSFELTLSGPSDPSGADTTAGFEYSFDCGDGEDYGAFGDDASRSCPTSDDGAREVGAKIRDKDGGVREYPGTVTVDNVAPTITSFTGTEYLHGPLAFNGGGASNSAFTTLFSDPGTADTHSADFEYSDGSVLTETLSPFVSGQVVRHQFASAGCDKSATVKVTDEEGDYDTAETTVDVGAGSFLPPMTNQPVTDKLKNGQVLPVKIRIASCEGTGATTLAPTIRLVAGDQTAVAEESSGLIAPTSVSAADTTGVMRHSSNGEYIYNLKIQLPLSTKYTVVVHPYGGTSGPRLAHLIEATK